MLIIQSVQTGEHPHELDVTLLPGCTIDVPHAPGQPLQLKLQLTRRLDIVCPRSLATIHFGGEPLKKNRRNWIGLAPQAENEC